MLDIARVPKSSYYKWKGNKNRQRKEEKEKELVEIIKTIYEETKGTLGVIRMTEELRRNKVIVNHKKVNRIMRENGYLSVVKRKKTYTKPGKPHPKHNVLKRNFKTSCPYDKMATDVTEVKILGMKMYISPIKDLHTNMIESVEIGKHANLKMAVKMFEKIKDSSIKEGTILHSDQGAIYNNLKYQKLLEKHNFIQSMSRKGTPIDNSPMESFFSTLKSELIYNPLVKINSYEELEEKIKEYIEFYNTKRIQKKLGYLTPSEFKEKCLIAQ